jgi:class 3 adenylate cyclase
VNMASRMESHGAPGRIQITRATYELLADEFECEPRGTIAVKGKGEVEVWHLIRLRGDRPSAASDEAREPTLADRGHAWPARNTGPRSTRS